MGRRSRRLHAIRTNWRTIFPGSIGEKLKSEPPHRKIRSSIAPTQRRDSLRLRGRKEALWYSGGFFRTAPCSCLEPPFGLPFGNCSAFLLDLMRRAKYKLRMNKLDGC